MKPGTYIKVEPFRPEHSDTAVLNVRKGPATSYAIATQIRKNEVYTIVAEESGWGKLKSGAGWIYLGYTVKR